MKISSLILSIALLSLLACTHNTTPSELSSLLRERDSLQSLYEEIGSRIAALNADIAKADASVGARLTTVTTTILQTQKFARYIEVQGSLQSDKAIMLHAEMPGMVSSIPVKEGDVVNSGQILLLIDSDILRKNLQEAETAYELSLTLFEKQESLWKQQIGSEVQYLQAKTQKESMEKRIGGLKAQLEKATVRAPFSGVIEQIFAREGEMASGMLPLIRLVNNAEMYVNADVSEKYLPNIKKGSKAMLTFNSINDTIRATVSQTGQYINPGNRTFRVRFEIQDPHPLLKPNLIAIVKVKDTEIDSALVIDNNLIQYDAQGNRFVYILEKNKHENTAKKQLIKVAEVYDGKALITEGLRVGDELLVLGAQAVKDGELVNVNNNF